MLLVLFFSILLIAGVTPPDTISLQYCYREVNENYPKVQNIELQQQITELNVNIANSGYYPDVSVNGQASYQSEVTEFSFPDGGGAPSVSKDQYKASVDVTQTIFNGNTVGIRKGLEQAKGGREIHSTRVELHKVRSQVDQVYFGILLSRQQLETINLLIWDLGEQLSVVRSKVENGVLLPGQHHILKAELIKARQDSAETQSNIRVGYSVLGEIIGDTIPIQTELTLPEIALDYSTLQPQRPELDVFESNQKVAEQKMKLSESKKWPRLSAFGTAAYGRPGLNFLNDDFHNYYIVGLRLRWNFWQALNADRKQQALQIRQQEIEQNRRAFSRQLNASLNRTGERIITIKENIERDKEAIALREKIVEESASQLKNGAITVTEYVTERTHANRARLLLYLNRVRLAQAQTDYLTILGRSLDK